MATSIEEKGDEILKFEKLNSSVDSTFWQQFGRKKIDEFKLSEDPVEIYGTFTGGISHSNVALPPKVFFDKNSFDITSSNIPKFHFKIPGQLFNMNKIESFKEMDKRALLHKISMQIVDDILTGKCLQDPALLYRFFLISFADLKKHRYIYWLCFPAIVPKNFKITKHCINKFMNYNINHEIIINNFYKFCGDNALSQSLLFVVNKDLSFDVISSLNKDKFLMFGYIDNGNLTSNPSWFLRNVLLSIAMSLDLWETKIQIFCVRNLVDNLKDSVIIDVSMCIESDTINVKTLLESSNIRCVGWEKTAENKLIPKQIDLSAYLDPVVLSSESVDLNLKLMRWRQLPQIDLELIKKQKCLLCGAGTLGTYMSRVLLAWGCANITFVDNGKVSYSNPVRQCLYKYTDCIDSNNPKAEIAAKSVLEIFPSANCRGYNLSIPMIGHYVDEKSEIKVKGEFDLFEKLVMEHDIIFLLTDSRESRWCPTLLSKVYNKIVVNIALGFDSYLVMRHSHNNDDLGCYFCSDVVAPMDSLSERSLDQQCTVTRPGLAPIAVGLGIELLISYLQQENTDKLCKEIPHQIRGYLYGFNNILIKSTPAYVNCSSCSPSIVDEYRKNGWDFVLKAMNEPKYVEIICGLDKLKNDVNLDELDIDWSDDDDNDD